MEKVSYRSAPCWVALVSLLLLWTPIILYAANGKVTGRVVDAQTGEPLPSATVVIDTVWIAGKPAKLDVRLGAVTNMDGYWKG